MNPSCEYDYEYEIESKAMLFILAGKLLALALVAVVLPIRATKKLFGRSR